MNNILFVLLSLLFVLSLVFFRQNIINCHAGSNKKEDGSDYYDDFNISSSSSCILNKKDSHEFNTSCATNSLDFPPFLDRIGYFLASNDGNNQVKYIPTSLQDTDPKDFA